ncbi:MAG: histidine kinase [Chloroflexota bacterium]
MSIGQLNQQIANLEQELAELEASLPKHSIKGFHLQRIEDLEEQIEELQRLQKESLNDSK